MAVPWSPPAWMKTGDSLVGGQLKDDDQVYRAYAQYFVRFLRDYAAAGVPVDAISVQNEPQNRHPRQYPGTDLRPQQEARLIGLLGPALAAAGLQTRIIAFDHNWALHPDDQDPSDPPDPRPRAVSPGREGPRAGGGRGRLAPPGVRGQCGIPHPGRPGRHPRPQRHRPRQGPFRGPYRGTGF